MYTVCSSCEESKRERRLLPSAGMIPACPVWYGHGGSDPESRAHEAPLPAQPEHWHRELEIMGSSMMTLARRRAA